MECKKFIHASFTSRIRVSLFDHTLITFHRNREIEVIKNVLTDLDYEQELLACCILAKFAAETNFVSGSAFKPHFFKHGKSF